VNAESRLALQRRVVPIARRPNAPNASPPSGPAAPSAASSSASRAPTGRTNPSPSAGAGVGRGHLAGYWLHLDVDVLDPGHLPAVDSPEPGGLSPEELTALLAALAPAA
jgi:hypothetical protein